MVSIEKISQKFIQLDEYLGLLDEIAKVSEKAFLEDKILIGSAKYYLQTRYRVLPGRGESYHCFGAIQVAKGLCRFFCRAGGKRYFSAAAWAKSEADDKIQESACPFIWRD